MVDTRDTSHDATRGDTAGSSGRDNARDMPDGMWGHPYALAEYWADRTRWPLVSEQTPGDALHEVAVMATLADWLRRWLPIHVHAALAGGAGVEAVAAAAGVAPHELRREWQRWAAGQVDLWHTSNPDRRIGLDPAERDQVRALFPPSAAVAKRESGGR
jgi:arylsulfatase A-like enzyme